MSDVFREVDEELRRSQATLLWNRYGNQLLIGVALLVAVIAGWRFYQSQEFNARAALGAEFEAALAAANAEKPEAVTALTAIAEKKSGIYPALARLRLASEFARNAKDEAGRANAVSAFDAIGADASLPAGWQDLAKLRAGLLLVDTAPLEEIERRLAPLATPNGVFRNTAREAIALAAYRLGQPEKALDALQAILLDSEAPQNARQRAELLLAVVRAGPIAKS